MAEITVKGFGCIAPLSRTHSVVPISFKLPAVGPKDVRIKVLATGICYSDVAMLTGEWGMSTYPLVPGHEVVGEVIAVGPEAKGISIGMRVGVGWQAAACGDCSHCDNEHPKWCGTKTDTIVGRQGGFAETIQVQDRFAIPIPEGMASHSAAPLLCAGATVWTPLDKFRTNVVGKKVAVMGMGGLGSLAVQMAVAMGATEVHAISHSEKKKDAVLSLGATEFHVVLNDDDLDTHALKYDLVIETMSDFDLSVGKIINTAAQGGVCHFLTAAMKDLEGNIGSLFFLDRTVSGSMVADPKNIGEMLAFCSENDIAPHTHEMPMAHANKAVQMMLGTLTRPAGAFRLVLVTPAADDLP